MKERSHLLSWVGAIVPGAVALVLIFTLWGSTRDRQLPPPDGRPVGRATFDWSAYGGPLAVVWYPAVPAPTDSAIPYVPALFAEQMFHGRSPFAQRIGVVRDRAYSGVPAAAQASYPVVILSPAAGREPTQYAVLAERLASHGYVVVGSSPAPPDDSTLVPPRSVAQRAAGIRALLVNLEQHREAGEGLFARLDLKHVALMGQGVGAEASLRACAADTRCAAAIVLGSSPRVIGKPVLALVGSGAETAAPASGVTVVRVRGLRALDFTDDAVLFAPLHDMVRLLGLEIGGRRGMDVVSAYARAFLDRTIAGRPAALLRQQPSPYPEVTVHAGG